MGQKRVGCNCTLTRVGELTGPVGLRLGLDLKLKPFLDTLALRVG